MSELKDFFGGSGGGGGLLWVIATVSLTAVDKTGYLAHGGITITLPPAPVIGAQVNFQDLLSEFGANPLIIGHNGIPIMGLLEDMIVDYNNAMFGLVYADATNGWRIV